MKQFKIIIVSILLGTNVIAQGLPDKAGVVDILEKVNDYWISTSPETDKDRFLSVRWSRATYFAGHTEFYKLYPRKSYLDYAMLWANNNNWRLGQNKRSNKRHADNQCVGQPYMDLYEVNGSDDAYMIEEVRKAMRGMVQGDKISDWSWADALFMAMPVFSRLGTVLDDTAYHDKLYQLFNDAKVRRKLYDDQSHLWFRDKDYLPPKKTPNGKKIFWSRGNGWVFGALVRTLMYLPENDPHRAEYLTMFKNMAKALIDVQRSDGFWNVSLADDKHYPGPETSGTAFFLYGFAWGVNNGYLDKNTYMPTIQKAWNGIVTKAVHDNGKLGFIQGVGKAPGSSQPVEFGSIHDYGVGGFLLAGTEVLKLAKGDMPIPDDATNITIESVDEEQAPNLAINMIDGNIDDTSRWSAEGFPKSVVFDLGKKETIVSTKMWTYQDRVYQYKIETSNSPAMDFVLRADETKNTNAAQPLETKFSTEARYVKLTVTGPSGLYKNWISITEFKIITDSNQNLSVVEYENENANANRFTVYPNPVHDIITIKNNNQNNEDVDVTVSDLTGKNLINKKLKNSISEVDVRSLIPGMYTLKITQGTNIISKKMLKK